MSSTFSRAICAIFFVFGTQTQAEIPMVTTVAIPSLKLTFPTLPHYGVQNLRVAKAAKAIPQDTPQRADTAPQIDVSAFGMACSTITTATASPDAMITIDVSAPCLPNTEIHIFDGALSHTATLSLTGAAQVTIPAMAEIVDLAVSIEDDVILKTVEMPEFDDFVRVAMIGTNSVQLAATLYGEDMAIYKTDGMQVFSVDLREASQTNLYRMILRHHVTDQNCDQPQDLVLHRFMPGKPAQKQELRLTGSNCARSGVILELKNIVPDLKVAAN
jgi:hypothetical protein